MNKKELKQENIRLGTHGEDYGSWMSNPVFYIIGGITALAVVLAVLSFSVFHITGGADGPVGLDHMDQAPVCLWRRRDHGTGSPGRSLSSGL